MIDFKKFRHLGFTKPVPNRKKERRLQISLSFREFAELYEESGKKYMNIRGCDLLSVMTVLRSKLPTHIFNGGDIRVEMAKLGLGKVKTKRVLSILKQSGWIRNLKVTKKGRNAGAVMEVMYHQLPPEEAGKDRLIRLDEHGRPSIFRKEDGKWVPVPDEEYPPSYVADLPSAEAQGQGQGYTEAEPQVWLPSEWQSSERNPDEPGASPQYKEDTIAENKISDHPVSPLSVKGDEPLDSREEKEDAVSFSGESESAKDSTSSPPGRSPNLGRLIQQFVELGMQSINDRDARASYEPFVMEQMLPALEPDKCGFLQKWHNGKGREWLRTSPAALTVLALYKDSSWPDDMGRFFHRRAKNLTGDDWRKLLLGFDWRLKEKRSVGSLVENKNGNLSFKGWGPFWEEVEAGYSRRRQDAASFLQYLSHPGGESDRSVALSWIEQNQLVGTDVLPVENDHAGRFRWLYRIGYIKQAASDDSSPDRSAFIRNREAWKASLADYVATDRQHLAVVAGLKTYAASLWGIDLEDLKARHEGFMDLMHLRAWCYGLEVKDSFRHLFDEDPWKDDSSQDEEPLIPVPGLKEEKPPAAFATTEPAPSDSQPSESPGQFAQNLLDCLEG